MRKDTRRLSCFALTLLVLLAAPAGATAGDDRLRGFALVGDFASIKPMGLAALPELVKLYETTSDPSGRASIAYVFYNLGWKSLEAKRALMKDVHTDDETLRVQVQWALGRVSDDPDVVDVLLDNMRRDPSPLFRDKAACALAYDQIHLAPTQRVRLFEGLIEALADANPQVRQIAVQALQVLTGQTKGYAPNAEAQQRGIAIQAWRRWLLEFRQQQ